ncbi:hypothetical protein EDB80DRAFT_340448 [Ilyonectria destructans]|nr:hypothetical protein EDB80DRAFT_340448 [Ilyonectria destructans]
MNLINKRCHSSAKRSGHPHSIPWPLVWRTSVCWVMCNIVVLVRWALERKRKRRRRRERRRVSCNKWPNGRSFPRRRLARSLDNLRTLQPAAGRPRAHTTTQKRGFQYVAAFRPLRFVVRRGGQRRKPTLRPTRAALKAGRERGQGFRQGPYSSPVAHTCMSRREASGRAVPCVQSRAKARETPKPRDADNARTAGRGDVPAW